ncbi:cation transporter HKT8-like isoform X1 [Dioscorea cayenensis subsp. rotundata]|uniref:Cation transporter HKT8-like isoform X1 n=1 Tax=Dioscorea cayennensis subsp. rotundata TaxID=55577 RepID=A0AB40BXX0_DIOCR|nr:cation transporter HKT8-like isoform X1 [Dioscorea cayenensis subsp. rotundata]
MNFFVSLHKRITSLHRNLSINISFLCYYIFVKLHPFWIQLFYFILISSIGFLFLKLLPNKHSSLKLSNLDVFFMAVSASTVSSMSTIEMEVFSNVQLLVLTLLMLLGGEVFVSMLTLHVNNKYFLKQSQKTNNIISLTTNSEYLKSKYMRYLLHVILAYFILIHASGYAMIIAYVSLIPSARRVLHGKGLNVHTFTIFSVVSSFTNCGFIPTNENMIVFKKYSGFLLMIITLVLTGNTLFPACLSFLIWILERITRREEFGYILKDKTNGVFAHLFPGLHSVLMLALTVAGFIVIQMILFCCMEWSSEGLEGLNAYQKLVGALFQSVNSRHAGESIVDLSTISPAILVLYLVMMYLPPYTCFLPAEREVDGEDDDANKGKLNLIENLMFSQVANLSIFTIMICITERKSISHDPLNFNVLNIATEIISAYGNVGFSTGYSCERQLKPDPNCKDSWVGFSGRWSTKGKLILIFIMFFGRLKKFSMHAGKAWKLC